MICTDTRGRLQLVSTHAFVWDVACAAATPIDIDSPAHVASYGPVAIAPRGDGWPCGDRAGRW